MRNDFTRMKLKILSQVFIVILIAVAAGFFIQYAFIDGIFQDSFAEGFIAFCRTVFRVSRDDAIYIYAALFRNNKLFWLLIGLMFLLLLSFYIGLTRFTRYFAEITRGVGQLAEGSEEPIKLSPELDFMEQKLNAVNNTLQKRARDAKEAEQRKNDLVVYLAHDIKTPLTSVIGYLNLLDEAPDMPAEQRAKYTNITLEKAYRLEQLINEFFEITRFNLQTIVLDKGDVNLSYMLMQIADEFYPILAPQGKTTELTAPEGLMVRADADKLARVFNNILKNAAAYSDADSVIRIDARTAPGTFGEIVRVTFSNHGKTIPRQRLESIFEKFYRLDSARSSGTGGSGLGLAIAREIVNAHGGRIFAESEDGITRFIVEIPIEDPNKSSSFKNL